MLYPILETRSKWAVCVGLAVGVIFLSEGVQKWLYPETLGAGRFARIGIPWPETMGPFVGSLETLCGLLVLLGLFSRLAAIPLILIMLAAIVSVKVPIFLGRDWWLFHVRELPRYGFLSVLHEARNDWAMLMGAVYLLLSGSGRFSMDCWLMKRFTSR